MKAILYTKYGPPDVLQLQEIEKPIPKENEVLVKVHASSINAMEWRPFTFPRLLLRLIGGGWHAPRNKSFGCDLAGRVEAVGSAVKQFQPGDEVFGLRRGAYAEYVCAVEDKLVLKPANVSFEAAASVPIAALTALQGLRRGNIRPGQKVLIYGAGGGVGMFAVQIAKALGAEVDAVCSTRNVGSTRSIGAGQVMDYTQEDFTKSDQRYDLILAVNGYQSISGYRRALSAKGVCVVVGGSMRQIFTMFIGPLILRFGTKRIRGMMTRPNQADLVLLKELLEAGKIVPVIDRSYPLSEIAEAIRYLMKGHTRGKVVIRVEEENETRDNPVMHEPREEARR